MLKHLDLLFTFVGNYRTRIMRLFCATVVQYVNARIAVKARDTAKYFLNGPGARINTLTIGLFRSIVTQILFRDIGGAQRAHGTNFSYGIIGLILISSLMHVHPCVRFNIDLSRASPSTKNSPTGYFGQSIPAARYFSISSVTRSGI